MDERDLQSVEPDASPAIGLPDFLKITAQLALVLAVIHLYSIQEHHGFLWITPLIFGGFVVHAWLPKRWRPWFFLALSLAAIVGVLGLEHGLILVGLGLSLVGLCHLPIWFPLRVALVLAFGCGLAAIRAEWLRVNDLSTLVLPILGSMFMFRLIVYLYDLRNESRGASVAQRLGYFFLLPNVCFLLFPVIDYQTYCRTYYDRPASEIYSKGVHWMFRGVTHLLAYRAIYYFGSASPASVQSLQDVAQYVVATYLLYLRVSGQFHLIVGILCMFGFNLPATHHLYLFATSFNDYWRRINIYWKDFMTKVFLIPVVLRSRRFGIVGGLLAGTAVVFLATWLLHSYQWFWLRGTFPIEARDIWFWGLLAIFVAINSVLEARRGHRSRLAQPAWSWRAALAHSTRVVGLFVLISSLWTLWSSASVGELMILARVASQSSAADFLWLVAVLAGLVGAGVVLQYAHHARFLRTGVHRRPALVTAAAALVLLAGLPQTATLLDGRAGAVISRLKESRLNRPQQLLTEHGYYEDLVVAPKYTMALWRSRSQPRPPESRRRLFEDTGGLDVWALPPSADFVFKGARFQTNSAGLRDQEYERAKPPGVRRVALLGSSNAMGTGVANDETFEAILERRLNATQPGPVEILNFSVRGHGLTQSVFVCEEKLAGFEPDTLMYVAHTFEGDRTLRRLATAITRGNTIGYLFLNELIATAGVDQDQDHVEVLHRLEPFQADVIRWGYGKIVACARAMGAKPIWVFAPLTWIAPDPGETERLTEWAAAAGFATLSVADSFDNMNPMALMIAPFDNHYNQHAHALVAGRMFDEIVRSGALDFGEDPPGAGNDGE
jgi:hypothetical protein